MSQTQKYETLKSEADIRAYFIREQRLAQPEVEIALYTNNQKVNDAYDRMVNSIFKKPIKLNKVAKNYY